MGKEKITEVMRTFQLMVEGMENYSLILLETDGTILTWNKGVEKLKGYTANEIIGQHYSIFYLPEDRQSGLPAKLMKEAREKGTASFLGRRIKKNGTIFWGKVDMTAIKDTDGTIIGFTKLARELSEETSIGNFWFDNDGVLHTKANPKPHTEEAITELRALLHANMADNKICVIADIREAQLTEAAHSFAQQGIKDTYKAIAFISDTVIDENTYTVLSMIPKDIPTKVFSSRDLAKQWIKEFI